MSERYSERKFICIMCPLGCEVTIKLDEAGEIREIIGNKCPKGEKYAGGELKNPTRVLTSTIAIKNALHARLPVRTSKPIPKDKLFKCMEEMRKVEAKAPVKIGEVIIKNINGFGVDLIATRSIQ